MSAPQPQFALHVPEQVIESIAARVAELLEARLDAETQSEPWIGVSETAEHLGCKPQRIYALVHQRRLKPRREGGRLLFKRSELDAWVAGGGARSLGPGIGDVRRGG